MDWITTTTVLASLRDFNDESAWGRFVSRFRQPVLRFARSIGLTESDAEDVTQETLVAFAEGFRKGQYDRTKGRLSQWLFGIAYRKAMDEQRRAARRPGVQAPPASSSADGRLVDEATLIATWDLEWEQSLMEQCLEQARNEVEPVTFRAFEMVVRECRDAGEVAAALGVNIKLVYNAKHRVLTRVRRLRAEFEQVD